MGCLKLLARIGGEKYINNNIWEAKTDRSLAVTAKNFIIIGVTKMACEGIDSLQLAQKRAQ